MADKSVLKALYEVKKRKDESMTTDIFKSVENYKNGAKFILRDDLKAVANGHTIVIVGAEITITEEEDGDGGPNKQKILSAEERKRFEKARKIASDNWDFLDNKEDIRMEKEDKNPFDDIVLKKDENDLEL